MRAVNPGLDLALRIQFEHSLGDHTDSCAPGVADLARVGSARFIWSGSLTTVTGFFARSGFGYRLAARNRYAPLITLRGGSRLGIDAWHACTHLTITSSSTLGGGGVQSIATAPDRLRFAPCGGAGGGGGAGKKPLEGMEDAAAR